MGSTLLNHAMHDGSRHFASLPEAYSVDRPPWERLRDAVERLPGARLTRFVTDHVTEAWIDVAYCGHEIAINNAPGEWWFFVSDPSCADDVLARVVAHFAVVLGTAEP